MEMTIKANGFTDLSMDEMQALDGGGAELLWVLVGYVAGKVLDECLKNPTGNQNSYGGGIGNMNRYY